jgi:type II restriction/modification system DNA methylase subunit YeeA
LQAKLFGDTFILSDVENSILENNLFGVDLNEESVEIAKLSLWLRTAQPNRKLNDLSGNIKCGNSLIDDPEIAGDKAFNWQEAFPRVFAKGGFDVIIGNPPYVQLQSMGAVSEDLQKMKYQTFEKTSDLYCLFHELGNIILREKGLLGFITSNKWLRANYGKSLRNYLLENTQPLELIDLGSGIFESATVDSNILIFKKSKNNQEPFVGLDISKEKIFIDFSVYENLKVKINPTKDDIWAISNPIESKIKSKVEAIGIPLKDWDIKINRGILTGLNEAFIIDEITKNELISKDSKNAEIIHPILRGRDINRYNTDYQNLYLINVHNGYNSITEIKIEDYPTIKEHLDKFYPQLEKRGDKGKTPYNLRNCAYVDDFFNENLFYPDICQRLSFSKVNSMFSNNTGYYLKTNDSYILSVLNSKLINYYYKKISAQLGETGIRSFTIYIENIPIPKVTDEEKKPFIEKADQMLSLSKDLQEIATKFQRTLQRKFNLEDLPKKLENWYELTFAEFVKELAKKKVKLSLSEEAEWEDYFLQEQKKAVAIKNEIVATDKAIDKMVYKLYGLSEEEISIVENS